MSKSLDVQTHAGWTPAGMSMPHPHPQPQFTQIDIFIFIFAGVIKDLNKDGLPAVEMEDLADKLLSMLSHIPPLNASDKDHAIVMPQVNMEYLKR